MEFRPASAGMRVMSNLLTDAIFTAKNRSGAQLELSLPALYVEMAADNLDELCALRPHQQGAMHAFLAQLGFLACEKAGLEVLPTIESQWRDALRQLSTAWPGDEPWQLFVPDLAQPAFLQPPPGKSPLKNQIDFADQVDMLVTSKNHDLKQRLFASDRAEDWALALISLQTQEGFLGAGNFGIARMNGGFANRSYITIADASFGFGGRVARDIRCLLQNPGQVYRNSFLGSEDGCSLLWTVPWDGESALSLKHLHPMFIEVCRRIRLRRNDAGKWVAHAGSSKCARIDAKTMAGNVGDPWLALDVEKEPKAMTLAADGFSYRRVHRLLFDSKKYAFPWLAEPSRLDGESDLVLECMGLVRGQGKTEGVHKRRVFLPTRSVQLFQCGQRQLLAQRSEKMLNLCASAQGKALRPALIQLAQGTEDVSWAKPSNDKLCKPWLDRFEAEVDRHFYTELFNSVELDEQLADAKLSQLLARWARDALTAASMSMPGNESRKDLALGRARQLLESALRKQLPLLPAKAATQPFDTQLEPST